MGGACAVCPLCQAAVTEKTASGDSGFPKILMQSVKIPYMLTRTRFSIMRQMIFLTLTLLAVSCSPKVYPVQRDTVTQVRTEIVERLVRDTVEITLPQDSVYVQTRDTMSVLHIKAAISEASVSGGILSHTLYSNPAYKPEIEVVYKDRIEYRDTTIYASNTEVIEVERELSGWQRMMMAGGYILLGAAVLLVVLWILKWRKVI